MGPYCNSSHPPHRPRPQSDRRYATRSSGAARVTTSPLAVPLPVIVYARPNVADAVSLVSTRSADPALRFGLTLDLADPTRDRVWMRTGRFGDHPHTPTTQLHSLATEQQAALPLIKVRPQHRIPASQRLHPLRALGHSTTVEPSNLKT